jgi:hypothetical protein
MTYSLTPDEKITILNQHLRSLAFSKYNYEVSLSEEMAAESADQATVDSLTLEIADINRKIDSLVNQVNQLQNP